MRLTSDERLVAKYISECSDGDFTSALCDNDNFAVFYHLTPMRESLLNWYDFAPDAAVLETHGDMGALTGLLCFRCARVVSVEADPEKAKAIRKRCGRFENLTVLDCLESVGDELFDYIVALDPPSTGAGYFESLYRRLKPHGRLLLALENRFGFRYWAGKRSSVTGRPFDGITGRDGSAGKAQLELNLLKAGFEGLKWYYPLSDHWFTQDIFSENYLPENYSTARFSPYVVTDYTVIMNEQLLYKDIIQSKVFDFFSNAYLTEARKCGEDTPCEVDYAALTTYRDTDKRFATLICGDTVRKIPLHPDGAQSVRNMLRNHETLAARGLDVLPLASDGGGITMPRVYHETLIDYWQRTYQDGTFDYDAFVKTFDKMYDNIISASDADAPGTHGWDTALGPVQKTAYMEMVPANCFYNAETGGLLYFDQEFSRDNCPASLAVYRLVSSLRFSVLFQESRIKTLYEELLVKYGLYACMDYFEDFAHNFLSDVFNFPAISPIENLRYANEYEILHSVNDLMDIMVVKKLLSYLTEPGLDGVILYGYGKRGKRLHRIASAFELRVLFVLDKNVAVQKDSVNGSLPATVYSSLDETPVIESAGIIVVTVKNGADEIAEQLRLQVPCRVITLDSLYGI